MKRAWATGLALLIIGSLLGALCPIFWLHLLILMPFLWAYLWIVLDYKHSDFAWWVVLHPKESPKTLLMLAGLNYMKVKMRWKIWKSKRLKKKQQKK